MRRTMIVVLIAGMMLLAGCGKENGTESSSGGSAGMSQEEKVAMYNRFTEFAQAIMKGDMDEVKELAGKEEYLDARGGSGASPLVSAMSLNKPEIAKLLIEEGIKLDSWAISECTNIQDEKKRMEIVRLLIEKGADVNARGSADLTALHKAAAAGDVDLARLLLENGADPSLKDKQGKTPLDHAKEHDNQEVIQLLKKHGAI
ncbi:MAG: ankyrin repeat domain-containing protein [Candidatus Brocadiia bacterium]